MSIADEAQTPPVTGILLLTGSSTNAADRGLVVLTHDGPRWVVRDLDRMSPTLTPFRWQPGSPGSSTLCSVPIVSRFVPPYLDLLGLDASGAVHAVQFHAEDGCLELVAERVASTPGGYLAAARSGTYGVVAIARERIDWLNASAERFSVARTVNVGLRSAVACFSSPLTHEVLVVCADGFIARVLTPPPSMRHPCMKERFGGDFSRDQLIQVIHMDTPTAGRLGRSVQQGDCNRPRLRLCSNA